MKNVGDKKSTGAAAAASAMPFAFAFMKTSHEFSIAKFVFSPFFCIMERYSIVIFLPEREFL